MTLHEPPAWPLDENGALRPEFPGEFRLAQGWARALNTKGEQAAGEPRHQFARWNRPCPAGAVSMFFGRTLTYRTSGRTLQCHRPSPRG